MIELYSEILYEILHTVGNDVPSKEDRDILVHYLQEAFNMEEDKHISLLEETKSRTAPTVSLHVKIIEGKDLKPTDPNGLSDPFCIFHLASDSSEHYNTTIKEETLNPVWEENFTLPLKNPDKDVLHIEVWDFDAEESTAEKMKKIKDIKGVKGIKILMKEVTSASKQSNDLIGSANIPLKDIPAIGKTVWCTLEKAGKIKKQGDLKLHLSFSFEKNTIAGFQEHRQLLYVLLLHELQQTKDESVQWSGRFSAPAETILMQHRVQCGLNSLSVMLAKWIEFINVHLLHPLNFSIFIPLLESLTVALQNNACTDEESLLFWDATKKLLSSCMTGIKRLQIETSYNRTLDQSTHILSILSLVTTLHPPKEVDLLPFTIYDWLPIKDTDTSCDIKAAVKETVLQGSKDWITYALEKNKIYGDVMEEEKLNSLVDLVDQAILSLKSATRSHDKIFQEHFHFPYTKELYKVYAMKLVEIIEPIVTTENEAMKPVTFSEDMIDGSYENGTLKIGTSLFQLYLSLQQFSGLGQSLFPEDQDEFLLENFYTWFYPAALHWLYISYYKALLGIQKAVNLDHFEPVDETVHHSTSAVDTVQIFDQIKIFWKRLGWPDAEAAFTFATNIVYDICQCSAFYADKINDKVERMYENEDLYERKFEVKKEWCVAIRNIGHVRQSIKTCVSGFGLEELISSFTKTGNRPSAEIAKQTLQAMLDSGVNIVNKKIREMLERAADKMELSLNKLLMALNNDEINLDVLMKYLDNTLAAFYSNLEAENFKYILHRIWKNLINSLRVYQQMENNREPAYFMKELHIFNTLVDFFKELDEDVITANSQLLKKIEKGLLFNAIGTTQLIHQYFLERREEQRKLETTPFGLITVKMQLVENVLTLEILNARNLRPLKKNSCNPFVKITFYPEDIFSQVPSMATKVHKKEVFPLFEERFTIAFSPEQLKVKDGLIMFTIKDKYLFGEDKYLGEALASFNDIVKTDPTVRFEAIEQLHLKINRPNNTGSEAFQALIRHEDKQAKDFIKKRKYMYCLESRT